MVKDVHYWSPWYKISSYNHFLASILYFSEKSMLVLIFDLYAAGTETSSTTLLWIVLYLIRYPRVQTKCRAEIRRVSDLQPQGRGTWTTLLWNCILRYPRWKLHVGRNQKGMVRLFILLLMFFARITSDLS